MQQELAGAPSLGETFAVSMGVLAVVCLAAYVAFRFFVGRTGRRSGRRIRVLDRCTLEPRRSLYLVEVHGKTLLIGCGEGGVRTLAEVAPAPDDATSEPPEPKSGPVHFIDVLKKIGSKKT